MPTYLFIGFALGILAAIPIAWFWGRRTAQRVRQLEQRARDNERLAELGTLTGGLAHEIKNPLSTVGLNVQLLQEDIDQLARDFPGTADAVARTRRRCDALLREAQRLREILEDFLRFAGRVELDRQPADLNDLADELTAFFEPQAAEARVNLRPDLAASPSVAPVDAALLKQAVLNLMINATQAMADARDAGQPHGGADELIVRTANTRHLGRPAVCIHVTDTGPGLPPETVAKVFQPYFSTKRTGTGLGLPTARRIVNEHGGALTVHSEPGRGTDFTITLPIE